MDDKWREKAADREKWKTSGGSKLLIERSGRQRREKAADREKWKASGGRRLPIWRSGRRVEGKGCG